MSKTQHFDADGNLTGTSVTTTPSRWDGDSRIWEIAYTQYVDGLCECGVPRSVCMDRNKAWLVDFRTGYRCRALMQVQRAEAKKDEELEKAGGKAYPEARKWTATDVTKQYREGDSDDGQDGQS